MFLMAIIETIELWILEDNMFIPEVSKELTYLQFII